MSRTATRVAIVTSDGAVVCGDCRVAASFTARLRGLLGTPNLAQGNGLLIPGTSSIHTHFMRYAIDVVFIGADGQVRKVVDELRPWRVAGCRGARDVVELPGGECARLGLTEGTTVVTLPAASVFPADEP